MSRPIKMTRGPRSASAAVISSMMATLNLHTYFEAQPHTPERPAPPWGGRSPPEPKASPSCSLSDDDMADLGVGAGGTADWSQAYLRPFRIHRLCNS